MSSLLPPTAVYCYIRAKCSCQLQSRPVSQVIVALCLVSQHYLTNLCWNFDVGALMHFLCFEIYRQGRCKAAGAIGYSLRSSHLRLPSPKERPEGFCQRRSSLTKPYCNDFIDTTHPSKPSVNGCGCPHDFSAEPVGVKVYHNI